jgi:hypothetical protein
MGLRHKETKYRDGYRSITARSCKVESASVVFPIPPPPKIATRAGILPSNTSTTSHLSLSLPIMSLAGGGKTGL